VTTSCSRGTVDVGVGPSTTADILAGILQSVNERQIDVSNLLVETTNFRVTPGISSAFAFHRSLGLVANVQYQYSTPTSASLYSPQSRFQWGAALDFDLYAISPVAMGFTLAYSMVDPLGGTQNFGSNTVALGFIIPVVFT
jgi:hypothetical protein